MASKGLATRLETAKEAAAAAAKRVTALKRELAKKEAREQRAADNAYKFALGGWMAAGLERKPQTEIAKMHASVASTLPPGPRRIAFQETAAIKEKEYQERQNQAAEQQQQKGV